MAEIDSTQEFDSDRTEEKSVHENKIFMKKKEHFVKHMLQWKPWRKTQPATELDCGGDGPDGKIHQKKSLWKPWKKAQPATELECGGDGPDSKIHQKKSLWKPWRKTQPATELDCGGDRPDGKIHQKKSLWKPWRKTQPATELACGGDRPDGKIHQKKSLWKPWRKAQPATEQDLDKGVESVTDSKSVPLCPEETSTSPSIGSNEDSKAAKKADLTSVPLVLTNVEGEDVELCGEDGPDSEIHQAQSATEQDSDETAVTKSASPADSFDEDRAVTPVHLGVMCNEFAKFNNSQTTLQILQSVVALYEHVTPDETEDLASELSTDSTSLPEHHLETLEEDRNIFSIKRFFGTLAEKCWSQKDRDVEKILARMTLEMEELFLQEVLEEESQASSSPGSKSPESLKNIFLKAFRRLSGGDKSADKTSEDSEATETVAADDVSSPVPLETTQASQNEASSNVQVAQTITINKKRAPWWRIFSKWRRNKVDVVSNQQVDKAEESSGPIFVSSKKWNNTPLELVDYEGEDEDVT